MIKPQATIAKHYHLKGILSTSVVDFYELIGILGMVTTKPDNFKGWLGIIDSPIGLFSISTGARESLAPDAPRGISDAPRGGVRGAPR